MAKPRICTGMICIFFLLFACGGEETYTVEDSNGVRTVHNYAPEHAGPALGLELLWEIGETDAGGTGYAFERISDVAVDADGNVYVADQEAGKIVKYDNNGVYANAFGDGDEESVRLKNPISLTFDGTGNLLVLNPGRMAIEKYTSDGEHSGSLPVNKRIDQIRYAGAENVVLTGTAIPERNAQRSGENRLVTIINGSGERIASIIEPEELGNPFITGMGNLIKTASAPGGGFVIAFTTQNRIEKYSPEGELLLTIDRFRSYDLKTPSRDSGDLPMLTYYSTRVGVDNRGRIWVPTFFSQFPFPQNVEEIYFSHNDKVQLQVFDESGVWRETLPNPEGLAFLGVFGGRLYFTDSERVTLHAYRITGG